MCDVVGLCRVHKQPKKNIDDERKAPKRKDAKYKHEFNQQKGIARGTGIVRKMCQQSNVLLPDTD